MDRESIEYVKDVIAAATENHIQIVDGEHFYVNGSKAEQVSFRVPETLDLFSLTQVVNYIQLHMAEDNGKVYVNVKFFDKVDVYLEGLNKNGKRNHIASAHFNDVFKKYSDGTYLTQEEFTIQMLSRFSPDLQRDEVLKLVNSIKTGESITTNDDGFSQNVEVKAGVALVKEVSLKNKWRLVPYKTFPEVEQPSIDYILRVQKGTDTPRVALFECDGGRWQVEMTAKVREWLIQQLKVKLAERFEFVTVL